MATDYRRKSRTNYAEDMSNHAAIYPFEQGFVVIVHAAGSVWTKHYAHDLQAISDLHHVRLLADDDTTPFTGDFELPKDFSTDPLLDAGFHRSAEVIHKSKSKSRTRKVKSRSHLEKDRTPLLTFGLGSLHVRPLLSPE